jgi:hypothetical protein
MIENLIKFIIIFSFICAMFAFLFKIYLNIKIIIRTCETLHGFYGGFDDSEISFIIAFYILKIFKYVNGTPDSITRIKK